MRARREPRPGPSLVRRFFLFSGFRAEPGRVPSSPSSNYPSIPSLTPARRRGEETNALRWAAF